MNVNSHTFTVENPVTVIGTSSNHSSLILCEHASNHIPMGLHNLGLSADILETHVAWDPGALGIALTLQKLLNATLIYSNVSRLAYDCNRPPEATTAIPQKSEIYRIPGNVDLTEDQKVERVQKIYIPFREAVINSLKNSIVNFIVTIHTFTPIFYGKHRSVEIGVLHGSDQRLANKLMSACPGSNPFVIKMNEPYSASDGVAHSLNLYGEMFKLPTVMLEVRNDLVDSPTKQNRMAEFLAKWINAAFGDFIKSCGSCS